MTPLEKSQQESIIRRIAFIEIEMADLEENRDLDFVTYQRDRFKRRNVERIAENIVNAVIDIGKIVLAGKKVDIPGTYRELFTCLSEKGFLSGDLAETIGELSRTRNVLAHQYLDLKWEKISYFINKAPCIINEFIKSISNLLEFYSN